MCNLQHRGGEHQHTPKTVVDILKDYYVYYTLCRKKLCTDHGYCVLRRKLKCKETIERRGRAGPAKMLDGVLLTRRVRFRRRTYRATRFHVSYGYNHDTV